MYSMVLTPEVSKLSGWLNADAHLNMLLMVVTLDVSKLSGWLNADAPCRVERRVYDAERGAVREAGGRVGQRQHKWRAHAERTRLEGSGGRVRAAERTLNMASMSVTLDVSKLSGWLNAAAFCRVERRVYDAERGVGREAGKRGPAAAHERHARGEGLAVKAGGLCAFLLASIRPSVPACGAARARGWSRFGSG